MDETTQSESSTVVSSPGHLEHVRIRESLVLKLLLLQFIRCSYELEKKITFEHLCVHMQFSFSSVIGLLQCICHRSIMLPTCLSEFTT